MTIADASPEIERSAPAPEPEAPDVEAGTEPTTPEYRGRAWTRPLAIGLVVVVAAAIVVALFTGPLETQWYKNRQHHLAADFQEARQGLRPGDALGVLQVPRLGINVMVVEGDSAPRLRGGPGHRISTARPGARGNAVIMGHRTKWGGPFGRLDRVREQDLVAIQSRDPKSGEIETFVYKVRSVAQATEGGSVRLMGRSTDHRLTLVTGRGGTFSTDRLVVTAVSGRSTRNAMRTPAIRATTPGPSIVFNSYLLLAALSFALAVVAYRYLRRAGTLARGFVLVPLLVAGTVFLLLDLTLLVPPLQ
jgi:LPXTG-site transpeptidase (sortase) family protein